MVTETGLEPVNSYEYLDRDYEYLDAFTFGYSVLSAANPQTTVPHLSVRSLHS